MKLKAVLAAFFVATIFLFSSAQAAVVTVDVTIKMVNAQARGITVVYKTDLGEKTIELDVSRKAEITTNGEVGTLESLVPGQTATIEYHKDLGVVTKVVATGAAIDLPKLVKLSEIEGWYPWLSPNGLTVFWENKMSIWSARRDRPDAYFVDKKELSNIVLLRGER